MTLETEDLLQSILDSLDRIDYIRPDDIPDIELYMDQVTTFMDSRLKNAAAPLPIVKKLWCPP